MKKILMSVKDLAQWPYASSILRAVVYDIARVWPEDEIEVSDFVRTPAEDEAIGGSGIHSAGPPWRAIDLRIISLNNKKRYEVVDQEDADEVAESINNLWIYDPNREHLKVVISRNHGTGPHIHVQTHSSSIRRIIS